MGAHKKQRFFNILTIFALAVILTCIFAACGDTDAQNPNNGNGNNGNGNVATPYIRFVVDDVEYSKVQTRGNEIIVMPANPTKDGYTFVGWFWDKGTWERPFTANSMLNEPLKSDMAVYAYFEKVHEHTYSAEWTNDATNHWHASTCGHSVVDGKEAHVFNNAYICTVCGYEDVSLHGTEIKTNTLTLENNNISGKVPNNQEVFSFIEEIAVADGATFTVSTDINGSNVIRTKTVNLAIGDNTYYILVENGKNIKLYNVSIRRRPVYTVTFDTAGGTEVQAQQVEEDSLATEPTTERLGYDFVGWSYDFSKLIVKDEIVVATWDIITYKITYVLNGGENPSTNPSAYTVEDDITLSAPTKTGYTGAWSNDGRIAKGSTGDKHFVASYTINQYNLITSSYINSSCEYTRGGVYDYASSITLSTTPYIGYDFVGWYNGDTLLSKENTYVFTMPASNLTITAKTAVKADMQNFAFSSTIDSCAITGLKSKSTELTIPDYVTNIGEGAFYKCTGLSSITIPGGVTSIGEDAFYGCSGLTNIYYTGDIAGWCGISGLGNLMSYGLSSRTLYIGGNKVEGELIIPDSVTSIGSDAFSGCKGLSSIVIPDSVTSIGSSVFSGCTGLTSIVIPDSVTCIGNSAFSGCSSLESIAIPFVGAKAGLTSSSTYQYPFGYIFGTYAYTGGVKTTQCYYGSSTSDTTSTTYYIPSSLKSVKVTGGNILRGAFEDCTGLMNITINNGVKRIGSYAFVKCTGLTSITIPDSVMNIGYKAFYDCYGLTSVIIGSGVTIDSYAFYGCGLTSITIRNGVTSIGNYAFEDCTGLTSIYYTGDIAGWCGISELGGLMRYGSSSRTLYIGGSKVEGELIIPDSVTSIGDYAFSGCTGLTSIVIPDSVTSIGDSAFQGCSGLTDIYYNGDVTGWCGISGLDGLMGYGSSSKTLYFDGNKAEGELIIPDGVTGISSSAFYNCTGLRNIIIPDSVTSIGSYAFHNTAWYNDQSDGLIYAGKVAYYYKGTMPNNTSIMLKDGTLGIARKAFYGRRELTSIVIPDSVTYIGNNAFDWCSGLTSITIGSGVTSIGNYAFTYCEVLTIIRFNGTKAQWNAIKKGAGWNYKVPNTCKIICTDGTI